MISYQDIYRFFSRSERALLAIFLSLAIISSAIVVDAQIFSNTRVKYLANTGDTLSIGHIGTTDMLNSLYCTGSMTIRTACSLVFSGLFSIDPFDHALKPELASNMEISSDLKTYTVHLRKADFHDNTPVTSNDVMFTYNTLVKDPSYEGPYKGAFNGVKITTKDTNTVVFSLDEADTFFPYSLTIGILPQHLLSDVHSINDLLSEPFNRNPIGSGPYKVLSIEKGNTASDIQLSVFHEYYGDKPYIQTIHITGYSNVEDLTKDQHKFDMVYADNFTPSTENSDYNTYKFILPQYVGLFFNTTSSVFSNKAVRLALKVGTDRTKIAEAVGNSTIIDSPFPDILREKINYNSDKAKALLSGSKISTDKPAEIKLVYRKDPALQKAAEEIARQWEDLGIHCVLISQSLGDLQNNFLKTRSYDVLLIGERLGANIDLYPYFHSSQSKYPGLNFSLYKNVVVDNLLSKIKLTINDGEQKKLLDQVYTKILEDMPFIPLYTSENILLINKRVHDTFIPEHPSSPEELYALLRQWYIAEKQIWI